MIVMMIGIDGITNAHEVADDNVDFEHGPAAKRAELAVDWAGPPGIDETQPPF